MDAILSVHELIRNILYYLVATNMESLTQNLHKLIPTNFPRISYMLSVVSTAARNSKFELPRGQPAMRLDICWSTSNLDGFGIDSDHDRDGYRLLRKLLSQ